MIEPSIKVDGFQGFKKIAREYLDALASLDEDGRDNGLKALTLAYTSLDGTPLELHQAAIVMNIVMDRHTEVAFQNA